MPTKRKCRLRMKKSKRRRVMSGQEREESPEGGRMRSGRGRKRPRKRGAIDEDVEEVEDRESRHKRPRRMGTWEQLRRTAFSYDPEEEYGNLRVLQIGGMEHACQYCKALKFAGETPGLCCSLGKVSVPLIPAPPEPLFSLVFGSSHRSREFLRNVISYNSAFQMTSFVADREVSHGNFKPTFKVQGQVYHLIGSPLPPMNKEHKFLQIYFIEGDETQCGRRRSIFDDLNSEVVEGLQRMLHESNGLVRQFKRAVSGMQDGNEYRVRISADRSVRPSGAHPRVWNAPVTEEVAVIVEGDPSVSVRDIVLRKRDDNYIRISELHKFYDALQYPLMWWNGQASYSYDIPLIDPITKAPRGKKVSISDYYAYLLMYRQDDCNLLLHFQKLLNKFLVDMWVKAETGVLRYISTHQTQLRAEQYVHLRDAVSSDRHVDPNNLGRRVILPSTFVNGPRYLAEYAQDAMTYAREFHRASLFITFTCNPAWPEIKKCLLPGQSSSHRQDLIARVFRQKVIKFVNVLTKGKVFGDTSAFVYSVEWQKRGLPHVHFLLWLTDQIHINQVDEIICAELPDPSVDPKLFDTILSNMVHGPCGAVNPRSPCMEDRKCSKKYPRQFILETRTDKNAYPMYRRRDPEHGGITAVISVKGKDFVVDSRWIVPHSPLLCKMFDAHINVEFCSSERAIKYICKYMTKGITGDKAAFEVVPADNRQYDDEPKTYRAGRYVDSNQAVWRLLHFPLHERHPAVVHLAVHLENGERVYFTPATFYSRVVNPRNTTLTAFFKLCSEDDFAKTLLYTEVPKYFTWETKSRLWQRRKQGARVPGWPGIRRHSTLGRLYTVHVKQFECFCLRLLLLHCRGPTSFQCLRVVNGVECASYQEACRALGLLVSDNHWEATLREAVLYKLPCQLRHLFSIMVSSCAMSDPSRLWTIFKEPLSEDILHRYQSESADRGFDDNIFNEALVDIEDRVLAVSGKALTEFGFSSPERDVHHNVFLTRELAYDREDLTAFVTSHKCLLNREQKEIFDLVSGYVRREQPGFFFIQAAGGTGKSFLLKLILADVRRHGYVALALASSGIAGTVLPGGRTAHSILQLPLDLERVETPTCNISKQSARAQVLKQCRLLVWDEATMSHKRAFEAMDRCLRDIRNDDRLMGGLVVVLAGDFRQTLPVVPRGTAADELDACLKSSYLWESVKRCELVRNMRVYSCSQSSQSMKFCSDLLELGEGKLPGDSKGLIDIRHLGSVVGTEKELIDKVFPNLAETFLSAPDEWLKERAVLGPTNAVVSDINQKILDSLPGEAQTFTSFDSVVNEDDSSLYPTELLNAKEPSGVPAHRLILKKGVPIMLMRNLDPPRLCNGTRLRVICFGQHLLKAKILTGSNEGDIVFIPRIPVISDSLGFQFKRLQFPVRVAFAMTINKSQGQTLKVAGIHLLEPCFSHGQLYVACSRVSAKGNLHFLAPDGKTVNVVYKRAIK